MDLRAVKGSHRKGYPLQDQNTASEDGKRIGGSGSVVIL